MLAPWAVALALVASLAAAMGPAERQAPQFSGLVRVVGLGDSVMAGTACGCAGIVSSYAARFAAVTHRPVTGLNLGVPGDTTLDLRRRLGAPQFGQAVAGADVVIVIVGANDLAPLRQRWEAGYCPASCYLPPIHAMGSRLSRDISKIRALRHGRPATIVVTTYWNVFVDGAVARAAEGEAQLEWSKDVTEAAGQAGCAAARQHGAVCVDLTRRFAQDGDPTPLLAADGDHPNAAGVSVITNAVLEASLALK